MACSPIAQERSPVAQADLSDTPPPPNRISKRPRRADEPSQIVNVARRVARELIAPAEQRAAIRLQCRHGGIPRSGGDAAARRCRYILTRGARPTGFMPARSGRD